MTETALEQRVRRLEDIDAIKTLTARYASAVNKGWNGKTLDLDAIPQIFATDVVWTGDDFGTTEGVDAIVAELPAATARVTFSMHVFLNPVISVDGDAATGSWLLWIASIFAGDPGAGYLSADFTYSRTAVGWRIQTVHVHNGLRIPAAADPHAPGINRRTPLR
jgi:hypothetical protein